MTFAPCNVICWFIAEVVFRFINYPLTFTLYCLCVSYVFALITNEPVIILSNAYNDLQTSR